MKIAVFSDAFLPQTNGMVTHLIETLPLLAKKHKIIIFAANQKGIDLPASLIKANLQTVLLPSLPLPVYPNWRVSLPYYLRVSKILNIFKPDLIHFHSPVTIGANGIFYAKKNKVPLVGSFHGYFMEPEYLKIVGLDKLGLHNSKFINKLLWSYSNLFYNRANRIICPSQATRQDLINHGITRPVEIISNGININSYKMTDNGAVYKLPDKYLLYVGRISREKNIDLVIEAFSKLIDGIFLVIVGDGPDRKRLNKIAADLNINHKIIWLGNIDHQRLINSNIYQQASCFVSASTSETQGITFLEAMAFGLPLIGVSARAVTELIDNNGILCQPDNADDLSQAIIKIITDDQLRKKYRQQSLKLVKKHDINNTVAKLEKVYKQVLLSN